MTPRQTCPQPEGFGRNLRSKTRWFTGFCNSHQVSHFATFFIDARAEISVAESRYVLSRDMYQPEHRRTGHGWALAMFVFLGAFSAGVSLYCRGVPWGAHGEGKEAEALIPTCLSNVSTGRSAWQVSTMILPQVHLRKPCYDFSFL